MPDWFVQVGFTALLAVLGWLIVNKLNSIDRKLDKIDERQAKVEKDCVTWSDLEKVRLDVAQHDREIAEIKATCKAHISE